MRRAGKAQTKPRGSKQYNRTPVTNYYRADKSTHSPFRARPAQKKRHKYLFGIADTFLIIVLIASLVYSLVLSSNPSVIVSSNAYHSTSQYAQLIQMDFSGIANKNKITFNESSAVSRIEKQFPEVSAASIELPFFSEQPKVRLLVSPPAFKLKSRSQIYIVDKQGIVVTDNFSQQQFASLVVVEDLSGFKAAVGKPVISSLAASFISNIIAQSQTAKVPLSLLTLPAIPQEFDLRTKDQSYYVKFYMAGDPNLETGQFLAARQKFTQAHITPSLYLDVRVAGKIFYK